MARISCNEAAASSRAALLPAPDWVSARAAPIDIEPLRLRNPPARSRRIKVPASRVLQAHESFQVIYSPPSSDHAADVWSLARRLGRVHATSSLRAARGRLSDDSGDDVLSGSGPGCDGLLGHVSAGAPVRTSPRPEPDDLDELLWKLGHHAAVRPRPEH